jgi:hypothetical protein
MEVKIEDI